MWVFGYGSLMWDGWEACRHCIRRELADLHGFQRIFNKASIVNWGTKDHPCPTLNLKRSETSACRGIAFEFPDTHHQDLLGYLKKREGKGFALLELPIVVPGVGEVRALTPIYEGMNTINMATASELASIVGSARGASGICVEYIRAIHAELIRLGIEDAAVTELWRAVGEN
jgi:glutathione-specific gamma-glutamylcyclotransferase